MSKKSDAKKRSKNDDLSLEDAPANHSGGGKATWKLMDRGATIVGGLLATRLSAVVWRGVTGKKPPINDAHPDVNVKEAMAWAVVGGAVVQLVKVGTRRGVAGYWVRSTGELPPGVKPLDGQASR